MAFTIFGTLKLFSHRLSSSSDNDQILLSLEILINLYKENLSAQMLIKNSPHYETFQHKLVSLLSNKCVGIILTSLHLLALLSLKERLGEKVSLNVLLVE